MEPQPDASTASALEAGAEATLPLPQEDRATLLIHDDDPRQLVISADKRRLARVIQNLLDNAAKYGGDADLVELARGPDHVQITVVDSGPGVPTEERENIFNRFARGSEGGRRGAGTGTGLGLALVAEHVQLHGGSVAVEDRRVGQPGARFVVTLPGIIDPSHDPADEHAETP